MKVLLDACGIYPTVMREMLLGVAKAGLYAPLWSDRILEEWARAAGKLGAEGAAVARGDAVLMQASFPRATVRVNAGLEQRLWLPDPNDIHVLAAAIAGSADVIVTANAKDFPRGLLAEEGLSRADPDGFLLGLFEANPEIVFGVAETVRSKAEQLSGEAWTVRRLMKKARLSRLGKALGARGGI